MLNKLQNSPIARGFTLTILGSGLSKLIIIILTFYCTNRLTKSEFGEYSLLRNTLNMVLCVCALNFSSLCTKFTVEIKTSLDSYYRLLILTAFSLSVCTLLGFFLILLPSNFLESVIGTSNLNSYVKIIGLLLPALMFQPLIEGILKGLMEFKTVGVLQIISSLFFLVSTIVGIHLNGLNGAIVSMLLYYSFYTLISLYTIWKTKPDIQLHFEKSKFKENLPVLSSMIIPVFVMSFIEAPVLWISQLMLAHYSSTEALSSMTIILQIKNFTILIPSYFFSTFMAFAGKMSVKKEYPSYFNKFSRLIRLFAIYGVSVAIIISMMGNLILSLYGKSYVSDNTGLILSKISIPLLVLIGLIKIDLIIQEHQKQLLYISIGWNIIWLILFFVALEYKAMPLHAFFGTQFIGILFQFLLFWTIYNNDRNRLFPYT